MHVIYISCTCSMWMVKTQCERLERLLSLCGAVVRLSSPEKSRLSASVSLVTTVSVSPRTKVPRPGFSSAIVYSVRASGADMSASRSKIRSL